jgi:hypothetical protein
MGWHLGVARSVLKYVRQTDAGTAKVANVSGSIESPLA